MPPKVRLRDRLAAAALALLGEALKTSFEVFRIVVPVDLVVRVLEQFGVVKYLAAGLQPAMGLVGLPGEMALVWAAALFTNVYVAAALFVSLAARVPLTVAQATVLTTMMLLAHALPVELRIAQKAGARLWAMALLRVGGALLLGFVLHQVYSRFELLQRASFPVWRGRVPESWAGWLIVEAKKLALIFAVILALLALMRLLERLGVTRLLTRLLEPVLRALGMSRAAAPITIVGMTLGLSYGGGLIIRQARSGALHPREVFHSLALMGLCHSLIEDTLLMLALGGHASGVLAARLAFSLAAVFLLVKLLGRLPQRTLERWLYRPAVVGDSRAPE